jgi:hypothetical protein
MSKPPTRTPSADLIRVTGGKIRADVTDFITEISLDYGVGQVNELTIAVADPTGLLDNTPLAEPGAEVTVTGTAGAWEVGAIDAEYGAGIVWSYRCRSKIARQLRKRYKVGSEREVSPTEWVTRRVKDVGGRVVAQKSAKRVAIGQAGNDEAQSSLDIIEELAGELEWEWLERDGVLYFGDPYWAYTGGAKTATWPVTWKRDPASDALSLSVSLSDDDRESAGTLDVTLPYLAGQRIRPWDRLRVSDVGRYAGEWLVESVTYPLDNVGPVNVQSRRPRKPRKKGGST